MDWSGATNAPILLSAIVSYSSSLKYSVTNLQVYGSFILSPGMKFNIVGSVLLLSSSAGNILNTAGVTLGIPSYSYADLNVTIKNGGSWDLASSFAMTGNGP